MEARHTLRVSLRQLRVTLDAYAPALDDTVSRKLSRRAQSLARRLSAARDTDVRQVLFHSVTEARTAAQRTALRRLEWPDESRSGGASDGPSIVRRWKRIEHALHDALANWQEPQSLDAPHAPTPFAVVAADALEQAADRLARRFAKVIVPDDVEEMHAARLAIKTARYILKPLAGDDAHATAMMQSLRQAQDLLGGIHDAHMLRSALRRERVALGDSADASSRAALTALRASDRDLTHRIAVAFDELSSWHTAAALATHVARLHSIAESWRERGSPPMEFERKWLLSALPPRVRGLKPSMLRQGYLPGESLVERIRSITLAGKTTWIRTVKLGRGLARIEVEEAATPALGKALFALTKGKRVEKKRYAVADGELTWEIDDFTDRTLVLAEVEFPNAETTAEFPAWLAPYVVRDVTDETAFTNWKLAR